MIAHNRKLLLALAPLLILAGVAYAFHIILYEYNYSDVVAGLKHITPSHIAFASLLCLLNYFVLTLYDTLSFRYIGRELQYHRIALASFISYTFSHNIGFAALSGGAVRFRFYSPWGFSPTEIAQVFLFSGLNFWLGLLSLGSLTSFISPGEFGEALHISESKVYVLGVLLGLPVMTYLLVTLRDQRIFLFFGKEFKIPPRALALKAISVAAIDWLLAAAVFYSLLPDDRAVSFFTVLTTFIAAQLVGAISHVPGGLGVFEMVTMVSLQDMVPRPTLIGVLLIFRCLYYLVPFLLGILLFAAYEIKNNVSFFKGIADRSKALEPIFSSVFPLVLSIGAFIGGLILLFSGSSPTVPERLEVIGDLLPLDLIEASHFMSSLIGVTLVFTSWSIRKRLSGGRKLAILLCGIGIVSSLFKGYDFEEAIYCALLMVGLLLSRRYFYRRSSVFSSLNVQTVFAALGALICAIWLGIFSFTHVEYSHELWWHFAIDGDASRFLRASIGVSVVIALVFFRILLRPCRPSFTYPSKESLAMAERICKSSSSTESYLALLGDKEFLFNAEQTAFIMYRSSPRCSVAFSDPIGDKNAFADLIWEFRDLCDEQDSICAFYEVSPEFLPLYVDAGLRLIKLGEEARVVLSSFSLGGSKGRNLRYTLTKLAKEGFTFSVIPASDVAPLVAELKEISDEWLSRKRTNEKGFSLGFFSEDYITRLPVAVVKKGSTILGFANVLPTTDKSELSIDLMRYRNNSPNGLMDFLFLNLLMWGQEQGYKEFSLGMAPLSGLSSHKLAPLWNKLGGYVFKYGEHFYNFEGLEKYKNKYSPTWHPKYLAHSSGLLLPMVLGDIASLISGGMGKAISKVGVQPAVSITKGVVSEVGSIFKPAA